MNVKLNRAIIGYVLAGIAMLIIFLVVRFPGDVLTDYVKANVAARYPQFVFSIGGSRPSFPPGIAFSAVTVGARDRAEAVVRADALALRPEALSLLRGRIAILMTTEAYGGAVTGRVDFSRVFSFQGPLTAAVNIRDLRAEKCTWLRDVLAHQIAGTLRGAVSFSGTTGAMQNGAGDIDFVLTNGTFQLLENFLGFDKIEFTRVEGKVSFRSGAVKITQLTLTGDQLRASLKGNIILAGDVRDSQIDLSGTMEMPMQNNRRVTLSIGGTLGNPKTRFL
jgi:type II secretion system protein N